MDNKRPKIRKDKYNPYTLHTEKGKYYISFTDANNCIQKVLISKKYLIVLINLSLKIFLG